MKYLILTFIMLFMTINLSGQTRNMEYTPTQVEEFKDIPTELLNDFDKMGIDDSPLLNDYESAYFNVVFGPSRNDFDFKNKRIGFIKGSKSVRNKEEYFKEEKERFTRNYTTINGALHVFNEAQKEESGGYDAAIVYWCKIQVRNEHIVERLKKGRSRK